MGVFDFLQFSTDSQLKHTGEEKRVYNKKRIRKKKNTPVNILSQSETASSVKKKRISGEKVVG